MGKSQKKRLMRRHNPMRVPDSHLAKGLASASSTSSKTADILPIIQKIGGTDPAERKWACVAVSNLIQNDSSTRRLLQGKNIVGVLIARLTDSEDEVVTEALGALRNLCVDGGFDICAEMYNKNILVPLKALLIKISTTLSRFLESPETVLGNVRKLVYETADHVITILWCLSETSNKALDAINQIHLIPFLMSFFVSRNKLPLAPVISAAQCLYVLTDGNQPAIDELKSDASFIPCLMSIVRPNETTPIPNGKGKDISDPRLVMLGVLASGILRHVSPIRLPTAASSADIDKDIVLPLLQLVISSVSMYETSNTVQGLIIQEDSERRDEHLSSKNTPKSDHKSATEVELELLEARLRTVQISLEILTAACATLPESDTTTSDGNQEEDEESHKENAADHCSDVEMDIDDASHQQTPTKTFLPSLVPPLLSLIHPVSLSFPPLSAPSPHPPTTSVLSAIHIGALECLNNIFLSLVTSRSPFIAADKEDGLRIWNELWSSLSVVGMDFGPGQERRKQMWEIAVGVLWGFGNIWKGTLIPQEDQVKTLMRLCNTSSDPRIQVQCLGTLECLAQHPTSIDGNGIIANYLLSFLPIMDSSSSANTETLIQALSSLIDIYSDENMPYDINFRQGGFLEKLAACVEVVKKAVKAIDRRKEGGKELKRRGDEVKENLIAFIQYRKELNL